MSLQPKKSKYNKIKKGKLKKLSFKANNKIKFGEFGLKAQICGIVTARQIESARKAISYIIKRKGKLWIRIFPNLPITSKPSESRMGKGKGSISHWAVKVKGGSVLFEICGISRHTAYEALKSGGQKLPIKTKILD